MHLYTVTTKCVATLTEEWTITSERPLSEDEIADLMGRDVTQGDPAGIGIEFNEQEVDEERERSVQSVKELLSA